MKKSDENEIIKAQLKTMDFDDETLKKIVRTTSGFSWSAAPEESRIIDKTTKLSNAERNLLLKYIDDHPRFSNKFSMRIMKEEIFKAIGFSSSHDSSTNTVSRDELYAIHKFVVAAKKESK